MPAEDPSTDAAMPACDFVLWPPLGPDDPVDAAGWRPILAWFAGHLASNILIPTTRPDANADRVISHASLASYADAHKVRLCTADEGRLRIEAGNAIVLARTRDFRPADATICAAKLPGSTPVAGTDAPAAAGPGSSYYYIGCPDSELQDAYHAVCLTYWLSGGMDQPLLDATRAELLRLREDARRFGSIGIFGTGPSLSEAEHLHHRDSFNIICNTIVKNRDFCRRLDPKIIIASDAHFHFSFHRYSARLLGDIEHQLKNSGAIFLTFDKFASFMRRRIPSLSTRIFGVPAGRKTYGFDLDADFRVMAGDSVLNMFMLPVACFLGDTVALHGFTGRAPADKYFWSHSDANQYSDLMESVRSAHPAFFRGRDYGAYAGTVDSQISLRVDAARSQGKTLVSRTTTFYEAFDQ